jgi:hypothetical protein
MKIAKALKIKNRLAGELQKQKAMLASCNVVEKGQERSFDPLKVMEKINLIVAKLCVVKSAISMTNSGVVNPTSEQVAKSVHYQVFLMAELKGLITALTALNTQNGSFTEPSFHGDPVTRVFEAAITEASKVAYIEKMQAQIDDLQDEVDEFNAKTSLDVLDGVTVL